MRQTQFQRNQLAWSARLSNGQFLLCSCSPALWRLTGSLEADSQFPAVKGVIMSTINPIFGFFFLIAGLAVAVFLGMVLYKDKSK
jgi:hypothetical protein